MKVSIITPLYNERKRIEEYLKRLEKQTVKPEVVLVDGGSADGTIEFIKQYQKKHKNVKLFFESGRYRSPANARNIGLKKASGEAVIFLDVDGHLSKNAVEDIEKEFSRRKENIISFPHEPLKIKFKSRIQEAYWHRDAPRIAGGKWKVFRRKVFPLFDFSLGYGEDKLVEQKKKEVISKNEVYESKLRMQTFQEGPVSLSDVWKRYRWYGRTGMLYYKKSHDKIHLFKMLLAFFSIPFIPFILIPMTRGFIYSLRVIREYPQGIVLIPLLEAISFPAMAVGMWEYLLGKNKKHRGH